MPDPDRPIGPSPLVLPDPGRERGLGLLERHSLSVDDPNRVGVPGSPEPGSGVSDHELCA